LENVRQIKKLLLPVDFSENSLHACRYALQIAWQTQSEILIFHAYYSPAFDLIEMTGTKMTRRKLKENVNQKLLPEVTLEMIEFIKTLSTLPEAKNFKKDSFKYVIKPGSVKEELLTIAKEYLPDLVIMGIHGKNNNVEFMLGSITEYAINKLHFPVLAIPAITSKTSIEFNSIIYLTDFDETDFQSIRKLLEYTSVLKLNIHCIDIGGGTEQRKKLKMEGLIDYFKIVYYNCSIVCYLFSSEEKKNIIASIENYISKNNISMVSITHRKRNIIRKYLQPDLTKKLFENSRLPLLVFHS
jgi:nucleotide-binding universal stress UspA family protein